jgi:hypothetical protein
VEDIQAVSFICEKDINPKIFKALEAGTNK